MLGINAGDAWVCRVCMGMQLCSKTNPLTNPFLPSHPFHTFSTLSLTHPLHPNPLLYITYIYIHLPIYSVEGSTEPSGPSNGGGFEREDTAGGYAKAGGATKRTGGSLGAHSGMDGTVYTEFEGRKR